ncbi:hypothetical protein B0H10DRAFT_1992474 [Mycena sp. CBHHK59/15]|nr:hypothetical protein B0H10DRAFT_1992474 [Mycena sp. CBHHK59/15]
MREDRATIPLVCRSWYSIACQIIPEYLRILSTSQLRAIVEKLEEDKSAGLAFRGEWDYRPETQTPASVLQALAKYCGPSLRRIEWSHAGEAPAWCDLANLCHHAPNLQTLRLTWIFSYDVSSSVASSLLLPKLETLSLGLIPDPVDNVDVPEKWDPLLNHFSTNPNMLPSLRRFEVEIFPTNMRFFEVHGSKMHLFRTTNWSTPPFTLPFTIPLLPNLDSLVLTQSTEYVTLPPYHPTLRRICISPFMEECVVVPPRLFNSAVLVPLDSVLLSIDSTKLPNLQEIRFRNIGIFMHLLDEPVWLLKWARRWRFKGVAFRDMYGQSFGDIAEDPEHDPLLDTVRG